MSEVFAAVFLLGGAAFMLIAAIGILRLPDFYTRMHAITKAGTLGVGLILVALAIHFPDVSVTTRALVVFGFVLLTAPVSAHMIGRAGYLVHVPMWQGTLIDELEGRFRSPDADEAADESEQ